jgi:hypothetical protein
LIFSFLYEPSSRGCFFQMREARNLLNPASL